MGDDRLRVILELVTGQYKKEAAAAATSTRGIGAAAEKTGTDVQKMGRTTESAGRQLTDFSKVAIAAVAVKAAAAVKAFVDDSVRAYSVLNESLNAVTVSYGESAEGVKQLGEDAAQSLGLSNAEFNSFAVQMSAFAHQIAGDGGDVTGVLDSLSKRVSDFASVMNLEVADAALLFQSGLAGETEPLRKYGIDLSAAAVEAHALATGIVSSKDQLGEQEKVLARHSLLMERTDKVAGDFTNTIGELANATRVANAEMENNKAIAGEALVPWKQFTSELGVFASRAAGAFAVTMDQLFGDISEVDAAIKHWSITNGQAVDSARNLILVWKKGGVDFGELLRAVGLAPAELLKLRDATDEFLFTQGVTNETIDEFRGNVDKAIYSQGIQTEAARHAAEAQGTTGEAFEEAAGKTDQATAALERYEAEVRSQTEPMYALWQANKDLEQATSDVKAAADEYGDNSPEYRAALIDQAQAWEEVKAAQLRVAAQSGMTRADFEAHLEAMGLFTEQQIDQILAEFARADLFQFTQKSMTVLINGQWVQGSGRKPAGMPDDIWEDLLPGKASGGLVQAGRAYRAGEGNRPELMVIPGDNGRILSNADTMALLRGGRDGQSLRVTINYPNHTGDDILAGVQRAVGLAGLVHFAEVTSGES